MSTKQIDMIGKKYGRLKVISFAGRNKFGQRLYNCDCECGGQKIVLGHVLRQKEMISCGCLTSKLKGESKIKNIQGKEFGKLIPLKDSGKRRGRNVIWICSCKCGNVTEVCSHDLISGDSKTCGKCNLLVNERSDLVEEWDFEKNKEINLDQINTYSGKKIWWICKKCGHNWGCKLSSRTAINKSGCPRCKESKGNRLVFEILKKNIFKFEREKRFDGCRDINPLFFDFYISDYNLCIEYQGRQHYEKIGEWSTCNLDSFEYSKRHDEIKRKFCKENNIYLLEIPYWKIKDCEKIILNKIEELKNRIKNAN